MFGVQTFAPLIVGLQFCAVAKLIDKTRIYTEPNCHERISTCGAERKGVQDAKVARSQDANHLFAGTIIFMCGSVAGCGRRAYEGSDS